MENLPLEDEWYKADYAENHHQSENIDPAEWLEMYLSTDPVEKWLEHNRDFLAPGKPESLTDVQIKRLLDHELPKDQLRIPADDQLQRAFVKAIHVILKKRVWMKLRPETVYLSVMLLLRYVSKVQIPTTDKHADIIRLVTVACMLLAVRFNNPKNRAVDCCLGCCKFDRLQIERTAEVLVGTFGWEMRLTTPFHFVPFLVKKLYPAALPAETVQRINEIILAVVTDLNIMCQQSSVIALAAMLYLIGGDPKKTKEKVVARAIPAAEALGIRNVNEVPEVVNIIAAKLMNWRPA